MGEESCCEHVRSDEPPAHQLKKSSEFDQQEFRYGPGFVDKLKSRFISLSLQEKNRTRSEGEGTIRRYSSLENVLEQDDCLEFYKRKRPLGSLSYSSSRMPSLYSAPRNSFKRAKSMETLLLESEHNMRHRNLSNSAFTNNNNNTNRIQRPLSACDPLSGSVLINENLVIIETVQPKGHADLTSKKSKKKMPSRQVSVSSINDEELPKPDIVKTCKLIFETASKRPVAHGSVRKAPVLRQSAKNQKGPSAHQTTNQLSGKAAQQQSISQPSVNAFSAAQKFGAKENVCVVNGDSSSGHKDTAVTQEKASKTISSEALGRIRSQGSTTIFNGNQKAKPPVSHAHTTKNTKPSSPPPPPPVVKTADKTLVSSDLTQADSMQQKHAQQVTQNVEPVGHVSPTASTPNGLPASLLAFGSESKPVMKPPDVVDRTDNIKMAELVDDDDGDDDDDDVGEQYEDSDEEEEEQESLKPSALLGRHKPGGLWQKNAMPSNTVVYDFRGKEVKSHLPTNPAPFGCKPMKKPKKHGATGGGKGSALVNGSAVDPGAATQSVDDSDEEDSDSDEFDIGAHLPAISGITFVGENTKCGRSSLLATRNKKLKIQFLETTTTHEYPSAEDLEPEPSWSPQEDASLSVGHLTNGDIGPPNGALPPPPPGEEEDDDHPQPHPPNGPSLRQNMGVTSSGSLSRYTPTMLSNSSESFQLGVERLVPDEDSHSQENSSSSDPAQGPDSMDSSSDSSPRSLQEDEELKPGDPADMSSWSSSTSTSDLLF